MSVFDVKQGVALGNVAEWTQKGVMLSMSDIKTCYPEKLWRGEGSCPNSRKGKKWCMFACPYFPIGSAVSRDSPDRYVPGMTCCHDAEAVFKAGFKGLRKKLLLGADSHRVLDAVVVDVIVSRAWSKERQEGLALYWRSVDEGTSEFDDVYNFVEEDKGWVSSVLNPLVQPVVSCEQSESGSLLSELSDSQSGLVQEIYRMYAASVEAGNGEDSVVNEAVSCSVDSGAGSSRFGSRHESVLQEGEKENGGRSERGDRLGFGDVASLVGRYGPVEAGVGPGGPRCCYDASSSGDDDGGVRVVMSVLPGNEYDERFYWSRWPALLKRYDVECVVVEATVSNLDSGFYSEFEFDDLGLFLRRSVPSKDRRKVWLRQRYNSIGDAMLVSCEAELVSCFLRHEDEYDELEFEFPEWFTAIVGARCWSWLLWWKTKYGWDGFGQTVILELLPQPELVNKVCRLVARLPLELEHVLVDSGGPAGGAVCAVCGQVRLVSPYCWYGVDSLVVACSCVSLETVGSRLSRAGVQLVPDVCSCRTYYEFYLGLYRRLWFSDTGWQVAGQGGCDSVFSNSMCSCSYRVKLRRLLRYLELGDEWETYDHAFD